MFGLSETFILTNLPPMSNTMAGLSSAAKAAETYSAAAAQAAKSVRLFMDSSLGLKFLPASAVGGHEPTSTG